MIAYMGKDGRVHWRGWDALTVNEKLMMYEDYLTANVEGPLTEEQQKKLDAMLELARLHYEAGEHGTVYRTH